MNSYLDYYHALEQYRMIDPIYYYLLELVGEQLGDVKDKDELMILFTIYFSLLSEGNVCMSLNPSRLQKKWDKKVKATRILFQERPDFNKTGFDGMCKTSGQAIQNSLQRITDKAFPKLIGKNRIFIVNGDWLYLMKYEVSRQSIISSINRLYCSPKRAESPSSFDYRGCVVGGSKPFKLSKGQEKAVTEGLKKNLIITGGPGTGKTTSLLFLLLGLLSKDEGYKVYLAAPSGKASSRMKESISSGLKNLNEEYKKNHSGIISVIEKLEASTIHRLLGFDFETKGFMYNKNHRFEEKSIFVIDEASMIDICLFDSLLSAIPDSARVFIMGDKNQLPSVECGAVFTELLNKQKLQENIIELDESIRFGEDTCIFKLASAINKGDSLPVDSSMWRNPNDFVVEPQNDKEKPIFYYALPDDKEEKKTLEEVFKVWGNKYAKTLQDDATNLDENDLEKMDKLFNDMELAKILCAENEGNRGIKTANSIMIKHFIDKKRHTSVDGYYAGELIMVTKNNKTLDLANGDCGILVTFSGDNTLYLMVKKTSSLVSEDKKLVDKIFKIGAYVFYPFRMISQKEIDFAYAITIHKSQGSDYKNILVILPRQKGHPLINRQIVYTAITRTKGNTYILANQDILEEARDTLITRDTNIADA